MLEQLELCIKILKQFGADEKTIIREIVTVLMRDTSTDAMNETRGGKIIRVIGEVMAQERQANHQKLLIARQGLKFAVWAFQELTEKHWRDANKKYFSEDMATIIPIIMGNFPDGTPQGASGSEKALFAKFLEQLKKFQKQYLEGKDKDWARHHGYYDYLKMVLAKNP